MLIDRWSATHRRRALVLTALGVLIAAVVGLVVGLLAPLSHEFVTEIGPMPLESIDEVRVTGEVWLALAMAVLGLLIGVLWWLRGPIRGPVTLIGAALAAAIAGFGGIGGYLLASTLRGAGDAAAVGTLVELAPVVGSTASAWLAAVAAVVGYGMPVIASSHGDLEVPAADGVAPRVVPLGTSSDGVSTGERAAAEPPGVSQPITE